MSHTDDMSRLARELQEAYDSRVAAIDAMHLATEQQLADLHAQHSAMATAQRKELEQFAQLLRRDMAAMQHDMQVARAALSAEQRQQLEAYTNALRADTGRTLASHADARAATRERQRQHLTACMQALQTSTRASLDQAHAARMALHHDHAEARRAWQQFNTEMRQRRASPR